MKVIASLAVASSMAANGQETEQGSCYNNQINQCVSTGLDNNHELLTCNQNGDLTMKKYYDNNCQISKSLQDNAFSDPAVANLIYGSNCCQKGSIKAKPNTNIAIKCKRPEEVIKITKAKLGENCKSTYVSSKDLTVDDLYVVQECNGKNSCNLQYLQNTNSNPDMNTCVEAELDVEYLCHYDCNKSNSGSPSPQDGSPDINNNNDPQHHSDSACILM